MKHTYLALKKYGEHWEKGHVVGLNDKDAKDLIKKGILKPITKEEYNQLMQTCD